MQEFYFRRIEEAKRVRLRVIVVELSVTVLFVTYLPSAKIRHTGSWLLEQKFYDLCVMEQSAEYSSLIGDCENCSRSEYRSALSAAIRVNGLPASLLDSNDFSEVLNNTIKNKDYPLPSHVLLKRIEDFLKSSGKK